MATLLLTRGPDSRAVEVRRCRMYSRLLARIRSFTLDRALVAGASPDSTASLSLRAQCLISAPYRFGLARQLRDLLREVRRPPRPFEPSIRVSRQVLEARELIDEIIDLLESPIAVDARGVARLQILLRDGHGPLYGANGPTAIRRSLQDVIDGMAVPPPIHADA